MHTWSSSVGTMPPALPLPAVLLKAVGAWLCSMQSFSPVLAMPLFLAMPLLMGSAFSFFLISGKAAARACLLAQTLHLSFLRLLIFGLSLLSICSRTSSDLNFRWLLWLKQLLDKCRLDSLEVGAASIDSACGNWSTSVPIFRYSGKRTTWSVALKKILIKPGKMSMDPDSITHSVSCFLMLIL